MPVMDWIFLGITVFSVVIGLWRGVLREVISLVAWVVAFVLAQMYAPDLAYQIPMSGASESLRFAAAFVVIFVICIPAGGILGFFISKLAAAAGLGIADRLFGAAFGLLRGALVLLSVSVVVAMTPLKTAQWWREAAGPRVAELVLKDIKPVLPTDFGKYLP